MQLRLQFILLLVSVFAGELLPRPLRLHTQSKGACKYTSGAVIAGAQVVLAGQEGKTVAQGITDDSGNFSFAAISTGFYVVDVTKQGFREIT
jgi:hypothetical protein